LAFTHDQTVPAHYSKAPLFRRSTIPKLRVRVRVRFRVEVDWFGVSRVMVSRVMLRVSRVRASGPLE